MRKLVLMSTVMLAMSSQLCANGTISVNIQDMNGSPVAGVARLWGIDTYGGTQTWWVEDFQTSDSSGNVSWTYDDIKAFTNVDLGGSYDWNISVWSNDTPIGPNTLFGYPYPTPGVKWRQFVNYDPDAEDITVTLKAPGGDGQSTYGYSAGLHKVEMAVDLGDTDFTGGVMSLATENPEKPWESPSSGGGLRKPVFSADDIASQGLSFEELNAQNPDGTGWMYLHIWDPSGDFDDTFLVQEDGVEGTYTMYLRYTGHAVEGSYDASSKTYTAWFSGLATGQRYYPLMFTDDYPYGDNGLAYSSHTGYFNSAVNGFTAVPEPLTMLAVGSAVVGLGGYIRRRRRA
jgi:hypothetical protein